MYGFMRVLSFGCSVCKLPNRVRSSNMWAVILKGEAAAGTRGGYLTSVAVALLGLV
jgi:hypothetical protein